MSTHNTGFYEDLTKIIFQLSSNNHLISSSELCLCTVNIFNNMRLQAKLTDHMSLCKQAYTIYVEILFQVKK